MLEIGWASRDITPKRPAMLQGQMYRRVATKANDPITLTALAIAGGEPREAAVFISCDLAYASPELLDSVRQRLGRIAPSLPGDRVIMHATHTHTSLVVEDGFYDRPDGDVMTPEECADFVAQRAAEAAAEAWESRKPRIIARAFGHAVVAHNRHARYADGHAEMYGPSKRKDFRGFNGYEDHGLDMFFTWDGGALAAVALAIPCPSQVEEHLDTFSADYWHEVREELRRRLGEHVGVLAMCGAAGDQSPHFLINGRQEKEMRERRGVSERREIALRVADAVERALACTNPRDHAEPDRLAHVVKHLELPPRGVSRKERDWAEAQRKRWIAEGNDATSWWPVRLQGVVDTFEGARKPGLVPVEIHVMRIGDAAVVTNPFELFVDYGLEIKAQSPAAQTFVVQIAGRGWYLPTEGAVVAGGYGAMPAVSIVGPEGGRQLVDETLAAIGGLFEQ